MSLNKFIITMILKNSMKIYRGLKLKYKITNKIGKSMKKELIILRKRWHGDKDQERPSVKLPLMHLNLPHQATSGITNQSEIVLHSLLPLTSSLPLVLVSRLHRPMETWFTAFVLEKLTTDP